MREEAAEGEGSGEEGLGTEDAGGGAVREARNSGKPATASTMTSGQDTASERGRQEISSTQRNADLRPDVEAGDAHARTDVDQRATVQDRPDGSSEPMPPRTPQIQTRTVAGLATPVQSGLRTALQRFDACSPHRSPSRSVSKPSASGENLSPAISKERSTPIQSQSRGEMQVASHFGPNSSKPLPANTPTDPLYRAETAPAFSESRLQDAKEQ